MIIITIIVIIIFIICCFYFCLFSSTTTTNKLLSNNNSRALAHCTTRALPCTALHCTTVWQAETLLRERVQLSTSSLRSITSMHKQHTSRSICRKKRSDLEALSGKVSEPAPVDVGVDGWLHSLKDQVGFDLLQGHSDGLVNVTVQSRSCECPW